MEIIVERATSETVNVTITDEQGNTIDLTGDTVTLRAAHRLGPNSSYIIEQEADSQDSNGNATFQLGDSQTDIEPGIYYFEIERIDDQTSDTTKPVSEGRLFVRKVVE